VQILEFAQYPKPADEEWQIGMKSNAYYLWLDWDPRFRWNQIAMFT